MRWHNVLLLAAAILISGCKEEKLAVGAPAPALAAFDLQGQESGLERWQGKAVYLNFWSAGCGGCLAEMDTLEALSKKWGDKVVVVAVNTDPETVRINDLLAKHQITYPVVRD
ncbi:TPA: TlpA family protein disulfide reductase, partial [Escherichia coli]|nr:TlpA family protein disulfide reductase [Escherichia coli]